MFTSSYGLVTTIDSETDTFLSKSIIKFYKFLLWKHLSSKVETYITFMFAKFKSLSLVQNVKNFVTGGSIFVESLRKY